MNKYKTYTGCCPAQEKEETITVQFSHVSGIKYIQTGDSYPFASFIQNELQDHKGMSSPQISPSWNLRAASKTVNLYCTDCPCLRFFLFLPSMKIVAQSHRCVIPATECAIPDHSPTSPLRWFLDFCRVLFYTVSTGSAKPSTYRKENTA